MVALLSLAHERSCEARMATVLTEYLEAHQLPDLDVLRARFSPDPVRLPVVFVQLAPLATYETLVETHVGEAA